MQAEKDEEEEKEKEKELEEERRSFDRGEERRACFNPMLKCPLPARVLLRTHSPSNHQFLTLRKIIHSLFSLKHLNSDISHQFVFQNVSGNVQNVLRWKTRNLWSVSHRLLDFILFLHPPLRDRGEAADIAVLSRKERRQERCQGFPLFGKLVDKLIHF